MGTVNIREERVEFTAVDKMSGVVRQAQAGIGQLRSSIDTVKNALLAVGVTVGAGAMLKLYADVLKANAALDDFSEMTGASVENLSKLQTVAKVGGRDFEYIVESIGKMIKGLKGADEVGQNAGRALEFLDIKAKNADGTFRDTAQITLDVAKALEKYADSGNKVALVQDIYGKGAQRMLPYLKDLAEAGELNAKVTKEQAAQAEAAEKNLRRLQITMEDAKRTLVIGLTPAIDEFLKKLLEASRIKGGVFGGVAMMLSQPLGGDVGAELREVNAQLEARRKGETGRFGNAPIFGMNSSIGGTRTAMLEQQREYLMFVQRQQALRLTGDQYLDARDLRLRQPKLALDYQSKGKEAKGLTPYEQTLLQLRQQAAKAEMGDSEFISTQLEIQAGKYKDLTAAQRQNLLVLAAQRDVQKSVREQLDEDKKGREESAKAINDENEKLVESANRYRDLVDPLRQYQRQLAEIEELRRRGLLNSEEEIDAYVRVLELLDEARLKQEGLAETTKDSKNAFAEMGFTASSALEDLIVNGGKAGDVMKALEKDLARIIFRKTIGNNLSTGVDKFLEGLFKPAGASSAGGVDEAGFSNISEAQWLGNNARGGDYVVGGRGGIDSQMVAFRGTPGERVSITPQGKSGGGVVYNLYAPGADAGGLARLEGLIVQLHGSIERRAVGAVIANAQRGGAVARALGTA